MSTIMIRFNRTRGIRDINVERIEMSADDFDRLKLLGSRSTGLEDVVLGCDGWAGSAMCSLIRHFWSISADYG